MGESVIPHFLLKKNSGINSLRGNLCNFQNYEEIFVFMSIIYPCFKQVTYLEQVLKELHSHRAVEGIMMWASWKPDGCYSMCLTDNNFKNLPTGDVVDKFIAEFTHAADQLPGTTDGNGVFGTSLFHGDYVVKISSTKGGGCSVSRNIAVVPNKGLEKNATLFKIVL